MSDHVIGGNATLVPAGRRDLATVAAANPLVARGIADLALFRVDMVNDTPRLKSLFYVNRGSIWLAKKAYDKAITDFNEAVLHDRKSAGAYNLRGLAWYSKKEYDTAIADYSEAIRLNPTYACFFSNRGKAWEHKKEYDLATKDREEALRLDPKYAHAHYRRGIAWYDKMDYAKAMQDFEETIWLDPSHAHAFHCRGKVWRIWGFIGKAHKDFDEAIRLDPKNAPFYCDRSACYRHGWALEDLDEAIRLDPEYADAYYERGRARSYDVYHTVHSGCENGRVEAIRLYDDAIKDLEAAIRLDPEFASSYHNDGYALAFWSRGWTHLKMKDYDKAIKDFERAIRLAPENPKNAHSYIELARLLATCPEEMYRDGKRAVQLATKACEMVDWRSGCQWDTLAAAYAEAGQFDEAER